MDGIISAPICIAGFFLLPDLPENTRAFYLSEDVGTYPCTARTKSNNDQDRSLGKKRMEAVGRAPRQKLTLATLRRIFSKRDTRLFTDIIF
jgi:ACS family pantothenate transporter-like MFS transporter